jgi:hypothetical protein
MRGVIFCSGRLMVYAAARRARLRGGSRSAALAVATLDSRGAAMLVVPLIKVVSKLPLCWEKGTDPRMTQR